MGDLSITWRAGLDASDLKSGLQALANAGSAAMATVQGASESAAAAVGKIGTPAGGSAAALQRLQRQADTFRASIDANFAAQVRYDRELERANGLLAKGALTTEQHAAAVVTLKSRLDEATAALQGAAKGQAEHTAAVGLSRVQVMEYGHVVRSVIDSVIAGQSPIRAIGQELPRIGQAATEGAGGLSALSVLLNPLTIGLALVTGAFALGTAAVLSYDGAQRRLAASIQYGGQASGATVAQMEAIADAAAKAGKATEGQARTAEEAFVTTGQVAAGNLGTAVNVLRDFTAATGEKAPAALEELAKALAAPGKGAEELNGKLHFLGQAQLDNIAQLERQGDLAGAQRALLDDLSKSVAGAADNVNVLAAAWRHVGEGAASAWEWLGKALSRAAAGPSDTERLGSLRQYQGALQSGKITSQQVIQAGVLPAGTQDVASALAQQIAQITGAQAAAQAKARTDTAAAQGRNESVAASGIIDKETPQRAQIEVLTQERTRLQNDLAAAKAGKLPGVSGDVVQAGIDGLNRQIAEAKRRESAADRRAASAAETAANKAAEAEKTTRDAEAKAKAEGLAAALRIAAAQGDQAKAVLSAAASDPGLTAQERSARIRQAAAELTIANAADQKLKIELDQIEAAKRAAIADADANRKLSDSQKARIDAAITAAAAAKANAARAEDQARQTRAETAAQGAGQDQVKSALGVVAGSDAFSPSQRVAAQVRLAELQRAEEQARLETILAEKGVSDSTKAQARAAFDMVETLKPSAEVQDEIINLQRQLLSGSQALATTAAQRLAAEKALLDLAQQQRRSQVEALIAQLPAGADPSLATGARSAAGALDAQEQEALRVRNLNPLAKDAYTDSHSDTLEIAETDVAQGLHGLGAELVAAARQGQSFGQVLATTAQKISDKIVGDLIDKFVTGPIEGLINGMLPQAATTATLTTATGSATAALATFSAALQAVAAQMGGQSGSGGLAGLFSLFGGGGGGGDASIDALEAAGQWIDIPPARTGGRITGYAGGSRALSGRISGPGSGTSDSILAMIDGRRPIRVSAGETIVNAAASNRFGPVLDAMNRGALRGYSDGGALGPVPGGGWGGGDIHIIDNRTNADPPPQTKRNSDGSTTISLGKAFRDGIRGNPEAVRDAMWSAPPKVTRRGG